MSTQLSSSAFIGVLVLGIVACGSDGGESTGSGATSETGEQNGDTTGDTTGAASGTGTGATVEPTGGSGTDGAVTIDESTSESTSGETGDGAVEKIYEGDMPGGFVDLEFHPADPEQLWLVDQLDESVVVITRPGQADVSAQRYKDVSHDHFMSRPPAMAFGDATYLEKHTWGTCADFDWPRGLPAGPTLYSADLEIFTAPTQGDGSHLDMLHATQFCRGIAHQAANIYWVYNSAERSLDMYDFKVDHGPGNGDHSDGEIVRHVKGQLQGVDGVPSHLEYIVDPADQKGYLYVADTGNARVVRLDPSGGTPGGPITCCEDGAQIKYEMDGTALQEIVAPGTLVAPSGLAIRDGALLVGDNATGTIHEFALDGTPVRTYDSGLPAGSLAGVTFGPGGEIYFVNMLKPEVYRIDPIP
jgi:hypothetical protein